MQHGKRKVQKIYEVKCGEDKSNFMVYLRLTVHFIVNK